MNKGFAPLLLIVFVFAAIGLVAVGYFLGTGNLPTVENVAQHNTTTKASATPASTIKPYTGKPQKNTLYLGEYENNEVIFQLSNSPTDNPEHGGYFAKADGSGGPLTDFRNIVEPKVVWKGVEGEKLVGTADFLKQDENLYVAIILTDTNSDQPDFPWGVRLVVTDLTTGVTSNIWERIFGSQKYGNAGGAGYNLRLSDDGKYLATDLAACYACDGGIEGTLVINLETKAEKYIPQIGNLNFDTENGEFTFQKLAAFKEACEIGGGYGCDENNEREVMKPSGTVYTEPLP